MDGSVCAPLALKLCVSINAGVENTRSLLAKPKILSSVLYLTSRLLIEYYISLVEYYISLVSY